LAVPEHAQFCPGCGHELARPEAAGLATPRVDTSRADPLVGQVVADRYRVVSLLGSGGMGVVYKVEHVHIGKIMAMKFLSGRLAADSQVVKRFRREAKVVSLLLHPNTVQVFDFGQSANLAYLVMEYLPGRDFAAVIEQDGPLSFARVARICSQVAASVAEAHAQGVIHRDIKPENVMVMDSSDRPDFVKVLDFGIAKIREDDTGPQTQSGHLIGTPYYMAPEQIRGERYDARVDVYALGAMMYKALSGVPPFDGDTPVEVLQKHLNDTLIPVRRRVGRADLPEAADAIIARAMEKDPKKRYPSMAALREDLERYLASHESPREASHPAPQLKLPRELATRGDVDRYERSLRRTNIVLRVLLVLTLLVASAWAYSTWRTRKPLLETREREPNDEPEVANSLSIGASMTGFLGKRQSQSRSDADVYAFELPLAVERQVRVEVSALPNIDLVLDLARMGEATPILSVDRTRVGGREVIPNLSLRGGRYYARVREVWGRGAWPTENVSDPYVISLSARALENGEEIELNDTPETANVIEVGQTKRGVIGWVGDRDVYCLSSSPRVEVTLSGVETLDLMLTRIDRATAAERIIDRGSVSEGEVLALDDDGEEICLVVSAQRPEGTAAAEAEPDHSYDLRVGPVTNPP
jgi:serine/threonine-protein kinase